VSGTPLGRQAKLVERDEEVLAGPTGADEGKASVVDAFVGVQGRDDTDHGRPV
jgi:hypothetical protein